MAFLPRTARVEVTGVETCPQDLSPGSRAARSLGLKRSVEEPRATPWYGGTPPLSLTRWSVITSDRGRRTDAANASPGCATLISVLFGCERGDRVDLVLGQRDVSGGEVCLEVLDTGGTGDRKSVIAAMQLPREGDLRVASCFSAIGSITAWNESPSSPR